MDKKLQEKKFYIDNAEKIVVKLSNETLNETEVGALVSRLKNQISMFY